MDGQEAIPGLTERGLGRLLDQIPDHFEDVGHGWRGILERAHRAAITIDPGYTVAQVKEKFGGLRIYLNGSDYNEEESPKSRALFDAMEAFEQESYTTCEQCGSREAGPQTICSWVSTPCGPRAHEKIERQRALFNLFHGDDEGLDGD